MARMFTVYLFKKHYYAWCGDDTYDDFTYVLYEFNHKAKAEAFLKLKQQSPDTNCSYYLDPVKRDFPACLTCNGRNRDPITCKSCGTKRKAWLTTFDARARLTM